MAFVETHALGSSHKKSNNSQKPLASIYVSYLNSKAQPANSHAIANIPSHLNTRSKILFVLLHVANFQVEKYIQNFVLGYTFSFTRGQFNI